MIKILKICFKWLSLMFVSIIFIGAIFTYFDSYRYFYKSSKIKIELMKKRLNQDQYNQLSKLFEETMKNEKRVSFVAHRYHDFSRIFIGEEYDYLHKYRHYNIIFWLFLDYIFQDKEDLRDLYFCDESTLSRDIKHYSLYVYHKPIDSLDKSQKIKLKKIFMTKSHRQPFLLDIFETSYYLYGKDINSVTSIELQQLYAIFSKQHHPILFSSPYDIFYKKVLNKNFKELSHQELTRVFEVDSKSQPFINDFVESRE